MQTALFLFAFNAILVYNIMNYMHVQINEEKGRTMLAEIKEIFEGIKEFCVENYIIILVCTNALALLLALICLIKVSKKKHIDVRKPEPEDMLLNLNIERAEVNIAQVNRDFESKLEKEDAAKAREMAEGTSHIEQIENGTVPEHAAETGTVRAAEPVVIEKLIPVQPREMDPEGFCTSKSGRVYSEEDIIKQIRD